MKNSNLPFAITKPKAITTVLLGTAWFIATLPAPAVAADLSQLVTEVARYESGQSDAPLRQIEQLVRESKVNRKERAELESALVKLLAPTSTYEGQRFACLQLAVVGTDASVPAIGKLLDDEQTIGIACLAFSKRPSSKANKLLRVALAKAHGRGQLQIISTLGNRRDTQAVKALTKLARDSDVAVAQTSIEALGKIANQSARKAIAAMRKEANPTLERALADASLRCAAELAKAGKTKDATEICEQYVAMSEPLYLRRAAFNALARLDKDSGQQRILQTLRGSDAALKPVAIAAVRSLKSGDASEVFARELPSLTPQEQVWMIGSLTVLGDAAARAAIIESLGSPDAEVRLAAAAALTQVGGATAVRPFARAIAVAKGDDEVRALVSALGNLPNDRDVDKAIVAEIKNARGLTRARLISSLAARRSPRIMDALFEEAQSKENVVAVAAYRVLAKAATDDQLPRLLKMYATLSNPEIRSDIEGFAEQAVTATENVSVRSSAVRQALALAHGVEARCAVLSLLPAAGDAPSLSALLSAVNGNNEEERDCSVRALSQWPDMAAWDALYSIYRKSSNEAYRSITLGSLVRLLGDANAHPDNELIARYRAVLEGARDSADLKRILGALGGAAHLGALKIATTLLATPGVRAEAEVAVRKIAAAIKAKYPNEAKEALEALK
jgi:HEAT repeat protein